MTNFLVAIVAIKRLFTDLPMSGRPSWLAERKLDACQTARSAATLIPEPSSPIGRSMRCSRL
jgi:hypothetical protein